MKENKITASPNGIGISEFHKLDITLTNENGTWNGQPIPVGTTHDSTAFMYILIGTKVGLPVTLSRSEMTQDIEWVINYTSQRIGYKYHK